MLSDDEFLDAFEGCTLPYVEWTHAAHLRMAWLYLDRHPFDLALEKVRNGIQRYNAAQGNFAGYHETVTRAFVHLIHHRRALGQLRGWEAFAADNADLFARSPHALARHYREATLRSPDARARFVEPDLARLP